MRRVVAVVLALVGSVVAASACSGDGSAECVPGRQEQCACPGGADGVQTCADDGQSFGTCDCGGTGAGSGAGGGSGGAGGGTTCDCADGFFCNGEESCGADGECVAGTPPDLDDNNLCTDDYCSNDNGGEILHAPVDVDDGDPCTIDDCDPTSGPFHLPMQDCAKLP